MTRAESQLDSGDFDNGEIVRYVEGSLGFMRITSFALYPNEYGQSRAYGEDKYGQPTAAFVKNLHKATDAEKAAFESADDALDEDDLETILIIARNGQSGRITEREIRLLVEAYRRR